MLIISLVNELPPIDYCNIRVSFESLYGIWFDLPYDNENITLANVDKLVFIFFAYNNIFP